MCIVTRGAPYRPTIKRSPPSINPSALSGIHINTARPALHNCEKGYNSPRLTVHPNKAPFPRIAQLRFYGGGSFSESASRPAKNRGAPFRESHGPRELVTSRPIKPSRSHYPILIYPVDETKEQQRRRKNGRNYKSKHTETQQDLISPWRDERNYRIPLESWRGALKKLVKILADDVCN